MTVLTRKLLAFTASCTFIILLSLPQAQATVRFQDNKVKQPVDLVIALDVSGSMSGLIDSAKQRLWDIVNEMSRAQPQPDLRIAIITYGNPSYGEQGGYVRMDLPFTKDLDAVMKTLFSFNTNGGDEYVARAVHRSVNELSWSRDLDAMKIIFVAGNEDANQDPLISVQQATRLAADHGIVVNTIYCGGEGDSVVAGWRDVATLTNGLYASIDQNKATVANIATPMDEKLAELNQALNKTYVAYGSEGGRFKSNQLDQDQNAADMSLPSVASRTVAKAGNLYRNEQWDLVDALQSGAPIEEMETDELPEEMQSLSTDERKKYVEELAETRKEISEEIAELGKRRQAYIAIERAKFENSDGKGLDEAMLEGLRDLARKKGFEFDESL